MKKRTQLKNDDADDLDWAFTEDDESNDNIFEEELIHMEQDAFLLDRRR